MRVVALPRYRAPSDQLPALPQSFKMQVRVLFLLSVLCCVIHCDLWCCVALCSIALCCGLFYFVWCCVEFMLILSTKNRTKIRIADPVEVSSPQRTRATQEHTGATQASWCGTTRDTCNSVAPLVTQPNTNTTPASRSLSPYSHNTHTQGLATPLPVPSSRPTTDLTIAA